MGNSYAKQKINISLKPPLNGKPLFKKFKEIVEGTEGYELEPCEEKKDKNYSQGGDLEEEITQKFNILLGPSPSNLWDHITSYFTGDGGLYLVGGTARKNEREFSTPIKLNFNESYSELDLFVFRTEKSEKDLTEEEEKRVDDFVYELQEQLEQD